MDARTAGPRSLDHSSRKGVVADRKVAVLDERIRHTVEVDAVGVGRVSWVYHRDTVYVQVGHCTEVNVPVGEFCTVKLLITTSRIKQLNDARTRNRCTVGLRQDNRDYRIATTFSNLRSRR